MTTVLVTGSAGRLGRQLVSDAHRAGHEVVGIGHGAAHVVELTDAEAVTDAIGRGRPDVVIHAAAWADVDGCEADPVRAEASNVTATRNVVRAARSVGAHVVYVSTDYVFGGNPARPPSYRETDPPSPLSVYGRTKLAGEAEVDRGHTIARISWLCGDHGPDLVHATLRHALDGNATEPMDVVADQVGQATFAADASPVLLQLGLSGLAGTYHVTNTGILGRYNLAAETIVAANLSLDTIRPVNRGDLGPDRAPRPGNSVLVGRALQAQGLGPLRHYREPLTELVARLLPRYI